MLLLIVVADHVVVEGFLVTNHYLEFVIGDARCAR